MSFTAYSEAEITDFLRQQVPALLASLDPAQVPAWGQLTPQHMVEHLTGALRLSMGRYDLPAPPPSLALNQAAAFLRTDVPFARHIRNPMMPPTPGPLRLPSLTAAVAGLLLTLDEFFDHYARQPAATAVHPMFGTLVFAQWQAFHFKHFHHHLLQFGLLPASLLPRAAEGE